MIDVCLLGCGGMMPLPGRFLTSLYVRTDGRAVLIDCGEGTQTAVRCADLRFKCIDDVLITHYHADHVSGLPGLLLTLGNEGRTAPLRMHGPAGLKRVVSAMRVIVPELPYEVEIDELPAEGATFSVAGGLRAVAFPADHGMPCFGYALYLDRPGRFDPAKARQNGVPLRLWSRLQAGEALDGFRPEDVLGEARRGLSLLYSTDTRPVADMVRLGKECDLMVLEGMFGDPEKDERARVTHHMTMREAAEIARDAQPARLWLTHFSPATPHPEEYLEEMQTLFPRLQMGECGLKETLNFA